MRIALKPGMPLVGRYRNKKGMVLGINLKREPNLFSYRKMFHAIEIYTGVRGGYKTSLRAGINHRPYVVARMRFRAGINHRPYVVARMRFRAGINRRPYVVARMRFRAGINRRPYVVAGMCLRAGMNPAPTMSIPPHVS